jgi:hypothetical protein
MVTTLGQQQDDPHCAARGFGARGGKTRVMKDLATIELGGSTVVLRRAEADDIPAIVDLLAADQLGATRDGVNTAEDLAAYQVAFRAIDADPAHVLVVAQAGQQLVGTLQLSFIPGLARRGALRTQIEAVLIP